MVKVYAKPTISHYKKRGGAILQHTLHLGSTPPPPLVLFLLLVVFCELGKSYLGELGSLEERIFGMNTIKSSSKVLLSFYHSSAYELDYSFHVIFLAYELVYSFYVMRLAYMTLCLIIHIINMIRIRVQLRWRFIVPSGCPGGIWVVSVYTGVVLGYGETGECIVLLHG